MKRIALFFCAGAFLVSCNNDKKAGESKTMDDSITTKMDDNSSNKPVVEVDSATRAQNWQAYMTPGPMHKMMAGWDGKWDADVTMWMPGEPEMKSKSTSTNKMIMNGLYQESENTGNMMGMPFLGKSTTGYDNHLKQFVSTWIDNFGTGIMVMNGTWDSTSKTITFNGKYVDPETKGESWMRETFKVVDDNTHIMEMFGPDRKTGAEVKVMAINYTRKK